MNIVQICPWPFRSVGGPANNYVQFHAALDSQAIGFINPQEGAGEEPVIPLAVAVRTSGGPLLGRYYFASRSQLQEADGLIARADFVFVHSFFLYPAQWSAHACQRHGVPYVMVLHGVLDPWALQQTRLFKRIWLALIGRKVLRRAHGVLCATQREVEKVRPLIGAARAYTVNWPCDLPEMAKIQTGRAEIRRTLGFAPTDRVLVYLGRLHSMKRPAETLRLLAGIKSEKLKLLVIGPDWDVTRRGLEAEARAMGWGGLRVVGPVFGEAKTAYLGAADGYISLSSRENFNFTLAEAMAVGLPVILSAGNDLGWEFADEGFSWQLHSDDIAEARGAVEDFIKLPDALLRQRGLAAREWVESKLNAALFREKINQVAASASRCRQA